MRILLVSSEVYPFAKTGGLADMVAGLAKALIRAGHQVGVVTPLYAGMRERFPEVHLFDWQMELPLGSRQVQADVWTMAEPQSPVFYFIDRPDFYQRRDLYQENGKDYPDNAERFIFFSKAATHLARYLAWKPEMVHVHEWQAGLVPLFIRHQQNHEGWADPPRTCLTIHNLAFQGVFPAASYQYTNLPPAYFDIHGVEFYGGMNCLKAGIVFSDRLTTVSPTYAQEILAPELGCGLDVLLRQRQAVLTGILNGVDYTVWRTTRNPHLQHSYSLFHLHGKTKAKQALQQELGLPVAPKTPLFGNIGRLSEQKGIDILLNALEEVLTSSIQFVLLGRGDAIYEAAFRNLAKHYPKQVAVHIGYEEGLPHRIEAGCDFYVMPSRYEPCGLNQMYSLRYGTIPIVRATGGLADSVIDITEALDKSNGIKFKDYSSRALAKAFRKALALYNEPLLLQHFRQNALKAEFCWDATAARYIAVYQQALRGSDSKPAEPASPPQGKTTAGLSLGQAITGR
jgi:starch synthase